jgi:hypothetical protein
LKGRSLLLTPAHLADGLADDPVQPLSQQAGGGGAGGQVQGPQQRDHGTQQERAGGSLGAERWQGWGGATYHMPSTQDQYCSVTSS